MINIPKFKISFWKVFQNTWLKISCISVSKFHIIKLPKSIIGDNERNIWAFNVSFQQTLSLSRGGSRATATSKMEHFVIIVNSSQPLTITTKRSILDIAAVLRSASAVFAYSFYLHYYKWSRFQFSKKTIQNHLHCIKCPNTELFLVRMFLYSDWTRRSTE